MPELGDVDIDEMLDIYARFYNINLEGYQWIKNIIKTPLSVKMFCELYRNKIIEVNSNHQLLIINLIKKKMDEMDAVFLKEEKVVVELKPITKVLQEISALFVDREKILIEDAVSKFPPLLNKYTEQILEFIQREGIIDIRVDENGSDTVIYWGMQPTLDYLIAESVFSKIQKGEKIEKFYSYGTYQMLSLLLIENNNTLISWTKYLDGDYINAFDLDCFALVNASPETAAKFVNCVKNAMSESRDNFRMITNKIIIPVSRDNNHPLGSNLLNDFLNNFECVATRDTWWSIPAYLRYTKDCDWKTSIAFDFDELGLKKTDIYSGRPLIIAWTLSNVNRVIRQNSSQELLRWGMDNETQYIELLRLFQNEKDQQIVEELYAIAYGLSLRRNSSNEFLIEISRYILEEFFSEAGLIKYQNTVIRYYGKGIVERAISRNLLKPEVIDRVTPPYKYSVQLLPLCNESEVMEASRMDGFGPINYDLARYVLCDRLDRYFEKDRKTGKCTKEAEKFIDNYSNEYIGMNFEIDGFIISMAYQYILNVGWTQDLFIGENKVDSLIMWQFYPATHGSRSKVMSIGEKYTWVAKHNIEAIFANEMPFIDYESVKFIDDYAIVEYFSNPYQTYVNKNQSNPGSAWVHLDEMANPITLEYTESSIKKWVYENKHPNFQKWVLDNNDCTILYLSANCINEDYGLKETILMSSGLCLASDFDDFINSLHKYSHERNELLNSGEFLSSLGVRCYCSPQEACLLESKNEIYNIVNFFVNDKTINILKLIAGCLAINDEEAEEYYLLPGKTLRGLLNITYGDGYKYYDDDGKEIAEFVDIRENFKTYQKYLSVSSSRFNSAIKKNGFKVFWLFRVLRSPDSKANESFDNLRYLSDKSYIVWKDDNSNFIYERLEELENTESITLTDFQRKLEELLDDNNFEDSEKLDYM